MSWPGALSVLLAIFNEAALGVRAAFRRRCCFLRGYRCAHPILVVQPRFVRVLKLFLRSPDQLALSTVVGIVARDKDGKVCLQDVSPLGAVALASFRLNQVAFCFLTISLTVCLAAQIVQFLDNLCLYSATLRRMCCRAWCRQKCGSCRAVQILDWISVAHHAMLLFLHRIVANSASPGLVP